MGRNRQFWSYGAPFLILLAASTFGLQHFTQLRYTYQKTRMVSEKDEELMNTRRKPKDEMLSFEDQFDRMKKDVNVDNWKNTRIERPWEK